MTASDGDKGKQLWYAVRENEVSRVVELLAETETDVNWKNPGDWDVNFRLFEYENTPLHVAAFTGNAECLKLLLDAGADVNAKTREGNSALGIASGSGHLECVQLLVAAGADVHARSRGMSALDVARHKNLEEVAEFLQKEVAQNPVLKSDIAPDSNGVYVTLNPAAAARKLRSTEC